MYLISCLLRAVADWWWGEYFHLLSSGCRWMFTCCCAFWNQLSLGYFLWHVSGVNPFFDVHWLYFLISSLIWLMMPHNVTTRRKKIDENPRNFNHGPREVSRRLAVVYFKCLKKSLIAGMLCCLESRRTHEGFWEATSPRSGRW